MEESKSFNGMIKKMKSNISYGERREIATALRYNDIMNGIVNNVEKKLEKYFAGKGLRDFAIKANISTFGGIRLTGFNLWTNGLETDTYLLMDSSLNMEMKNTLMEEGFTYSADDFLKDFDKLALMNKNFKLAIESIKNDTGDIKKIFESFYEDLAEFEE